MSERKPRVIGIIQARMGSTRLPGKVMMPLGCKTVLSCLIERIKAAGMLDGICVATTLNTADDIIETEATINKVPVYRGSEDDVLDRYCRAAELMKADYVVRLTADNPLTEPRFIDMSVNRLISENMDYVTVKSIPYGTNSEAVTRQALSRASRDAQSREEKEHVTAFIRKNPGLFKVCILEAPPALRRPDIRITMDTMDDYTLLRSVFERFGEVPISGIALEEVIYFLDSLNIHGDTEA